MPLELHVSPLSLTLKHPFKIARGEQTVSDGVAVRVSDGELEGLGEATPIERYGESEASVTRALSAHRFPDVGILMLETLVDRSLPPAARAGLDLALHDLACKHLGIPVYEFFGLDPARTPVTSFTIGMAEPETTLAKVRETGEHPVLKIKLGAGDASQQIAIVEAVREIYRGTLRIDANEGWDVESAVTILRELRRFDIEFCEQPIPAGNPQGLRSIRERCRIPIVTDEDSLDASDLPPLYGCVDGINVKLAKCGGLRGALEMIYTARAMGFKVMLGCMVESAIAATAAAHISPLVDWADLDGPLLTAHDPFAGITYERGKIVLPDGPGLGVRERVES